ncbi:hypothetical protein Cadr_000024118 [Camelus dromedarius]|uniref:Uncharacterized protein n=1 Tax=Camelus dromedarius TaxID=9838 RepID=A0A5N4CW98_CAMDR|nr:hypothetical protein Cadr_000024118 [Camelus dromedarius]
MTANPLAGDRGSPTSRPSHLLPQRTWGQRECAGIKAGGWGWGPGGRRPDFLEPSLSSSSKLPDIGRASKPPLTILVVNVRTGGSVRGIPAAREPQRGSSPYSTSLGAAQKSKAKLLVLFLFPAASPQPGQLEKSSSQPSQVTNILSLGLASSKAAQWMVPAASVFLGQGPNSTRQCPQQLGGRGQPQGAKWGPSSLEAPGRISRLRIPALRVSALLNLLTKPKPLVLSLAGVRCNQVERQGGKDGIGRRGGCWDLSERVREERSLFRGEDPCLGKMRPPSLDSISAPAKGTAPHDLAPGPYLQALAPTRGLRPAGLRFARSAPSLGLCPGSAPLPPATRRAPWLRRAALANQSCRPRPSLVPQPMSVPATGHRPREGGGRRAGVESRGPGGGTARAGSEDSGCGRGGEEPHEAGGEPI